MKTRRAVERPNGDTGDENLPWTKDELELLLTSLVKMKSPSRGTSDKKNLLGLGLVGEGILWRVKEEW